MKVGSAGSKRANFLERTEEVRPVNVANRRGYNFFGRSLSGVAAVGLDDAAELLLASNVAGELRSEGLVQHLVVPADSSMWPLSVVVSDPGSDNVVQLLLYEAHEVIEQSVLERADELLDESIGLGCAKRPSESPHAENPRA